MTEHFPCARWYTDDTRSHHHLCALLSVGRAWISWSSWKGLNIGRYTKVPVGYNPWCSTDASVVVNSLLLLNQVLKLFSLLTIAAVVLLLSSCFLSLHTFHKSISYVLFTSDIFTNILTCSSLFCHTCVLCLLCFFCCLDGQVVVGICYMSLKLFNFNEAALC